MYTYMKTKVTRKFRSGGLHERHVVATGKLGEPSQHSLVDTGKPRAVLSNIKILNNDVQVFKAVMLTNSTHSQ